MKLRNLLLMWTFLVLAQFSTAQKKSTPHANLRNQELGVDLISSKIRTWAFNSYFENRSLTLLNSLFYRVTNNNRTAFRAEANFSKNRESSFNKTIFFTDDIKPEITNVRDFKLAAGMQLNARTMKLWPGVIPDLVLYAFSDLYFQEITAAGTRRGNYWYESLRDRFYITNRWMGSNVGIGSKIRFGKNLNLVPEVYYDCNYRKNEFTHVYNEVAKKESTLHENSGIYFAPRWRVYMTYSF